MYHLPDNVFETRFADGSLDPSLFSHEGHIRLAWIHLRKYGLQQSILNLCEQIARFDRVHGDGSKFHKTLTIAAVHVVSRFLNKSAAPTFQEFIEAHPELIARFRELIHAHYSADRLSDVRARDEYLEPDLLPFHH